MTLPKLKFTVRSTDPLVYLRLAILSLVALIMAGLFLVLYRDFYQTIVQAETVLVLKQEVATKNIEIELYEKVKAIHEYKQRALLPSPLPDPFGTVSNAPATLTEATTTTPIFSDNPNP